MIYDSAPLKRGASTNIRLLELQPCDAQDTSGTIGCTLRVTQFGDSPKYTAVPYMWGDAGIINTILVNGRMFKVRHNLWKLLDQLRRDEHQGCLWIDAICIDQTSLDERSHQVAMMGAIYSKAAGMLCWLGLSHDVIGFAMKRLPEMSRENWFTPEHWDMEFMKSLEELLYNEYWTRVWILREFVLASTIMLHCSNHQVDSRALSWVTESARNLRMGYEVTKRIFFNPAYKTIQARREFETRSTAAATQGFKLEPLMK